MEAWRDFFVAQVGASAALAGLIFVGISISLEEIVRFPHLVLRAGSALVLLVTTLVTASVLLSPLSSDDVGGRIVIGIGIVGTILIAGLGLAGVRRAPTAYRTASWISALLALLAMVPFIIAGVTLVARGVDGLFWLIPGFMLCFIVALTDAWVLLVETHR